MSISRINFKNFLLNESEDHFSLRISTILSAIQELLENSKGMGKRQIVLNCENIVSKIRSILQDKWNEKQKSIQEMKQIQPYIDLLKSTKNIILTGAPGTGKSHSINDETKDEDVLRTTFHPDTDYASFVGAYKPTTIDEQVMAVIGTQAVPVTNKDGSSRTESKIVYEFVAQSFLNAYIQAWEKQAFCFS